MDMLRFIPFVFQGLASTSFCTTRPFMCVLCFAGFARFGLSMSENDVLAQMSIGGANLLSYGNIASTPLLLSDLVLGVLVLLTILEIGAASSNDLRFWYNQALWLVQPGSAFVVTYTFAGTQVDLFLEFASSIVPVLAIGTAASHTSANLTFASPGAIDFSWLGQILTIIWSAFLAFCTWLFGRIRDGVVDLIDDIDDDNTLGLQSLLHWIETGWTIGGVALIYILPTLALIFAALTIATLFLIRKYFEHREKQSYVACPMCATMLHPSAPFCPHCKVAREQISNIGLFGQAKQELITDKGTHRTQLLARKRCPTCATRLKARAMQQSCECCGTVTFANVSEANSFMRELDKHFNKTVLYSSLLGLIPVIGIIPAMVYYRLSLVSSLRRYLPRSVGCLTRWVVRAISVVLIGMQVIPGIGALAVALMCWINYQIYRQVFSSQAQTTIRTHSTVSFVCTNCGAAPQPGHHFCGSCGQQLGSRAA